MCSLYGRGWGGFDVSATFEAFIIDLSTAGAGWLPGFNSMRSCGGVPCGVVNDGPASKTFGFVDTDPEFIVSSFIVALLIIYLLLKAFILSTRS